MRSLNGWLGGRMLTLVVGRSSTSAWFQRKATFPSCPLGDRSRWFLHCTKCMNCACGRSWTKNSDLFPVSWWGEKLFVVSMDVASAFDSVSAQVLGDVLLERGATTISAAAVVRENLELRARPCLGFTKSASFSLDVGMRQGGPRTPSGWNQVMAVLVEELLQLWAGRAPAVSWAPEWVPFEILVWADNIFLVSSSIIDIVKRTQEIADVFGKRGLRFNQSSLEILPSKKAEKEATRIPFNEGMEFSWVQILVVLGCYLDGSNSTETQVKGRLDQGRKMFGKLRPMLCCSRISEEERIKTFHTTVASSVLWGSGCWIPSTKTHQLISIHKNKVAPLYAGRT